MSAGLGLVHKDFDGYRGRLRSSRVLWWLQGLAEDDEHALKCLSACKNQLCDNMIDKEFEESGDDTADEYESDNISGDNA